MKNLRVLAGGFVLLGFLILAVPGYASPKTAADEASDSEITYDGLAPVENSGAMRAWARPDFDLSGYWKLKLQPAGVQFRPGGETSTKRTARRAGGPFAVSEAQKSRFAEIMEETFREELAASEAYELTDETGPDVLLVRGALLDVVNWTPPDDTGSRNIQLVAVGEATLVVELRDSVSNAILARAIDRRAAQRPGGKMFPSTRVNNENELRRLARSWARWLRTQLEEFMD